MKKKLFFSFLIAWVILSAIAAPAIQAQTGGGNVGNTGGASGNVGPGAGPGASVGPCASSRNIGACIVEIYKWSLGIAVLLALLMIIASGYMYMTAGGNASQVQSAKEIFAGAFIGIIVLFAAVVILRTINPDLVSFPDLNWGNYFRNP